jgi:hypothetical protein
MGDVRHWGSHRRAASSSLLGFRSAWFVAVALGALALAMALRRRNRIALRVEGVPDWVYRAFIEHARRA